MKREVTEAFKKKSDKPDLTVDEIVDKLIAWQMPTRPIFARIFHRGGKFTKDRDATGGLLLSYYYDLFQRKMHRVNFTGSPLQSDPKTIRQFWFYEHRSDTKAATGLSDDQQRAYELRMMELKILKVRRGGLKNQNYFYIVEEELRELIKQTAAELSADLLIERDRREIMPEETSETQVIVNETTSVLEKVHHWRWKKSTTESGKSPPLKVEKVQHRTSKKSSTARSCLKDSSEDSAQDSTNESAKQQRRLHLVEPDDDADSAAAASIVGLNLGISLKSAMTLVQKHTRVSVAYQVNAYPHYPTKGGAGLFIRRLQDGDTCPEYEAWLSKGKDKTRRSRANEAKDAELRKEQAEIDAYRAGMTEAQKAALERDAIDELRSDDFWREQIDKYRVQGKPYSESVLKQIWIKENDLIKMDLLARKGQPIAEEAEGVSDEDLTASE
jgi:hypothetical protein